MVFAVVLAGGMGSRMGNSDTPKQYLELGGQPIIIHTIEKFFVNEKFEHVIVLTPESWVAHTLNMIKKSMGNTDRVSVIPGGDTRNDTLYNAIKFVEERYGIDDDTILVTHDAVRPFVTHRIIEENIEAARKYGACDTVVPATDTIVESLDGEIISSIPDRATLFQGQTPQSFNAKKLRDLYLSLTKEEKENLTDACKIFAMKGETVHLVEGEVSNIKITYPFDLKVAATMLKGDIDK
ncbi:MAG: 2-C-methyl-D-erythritol 4-phosphate cytidylyltransferase [Ruminococcaceae bacterium]|nr:2-C-methyl-D-erythritol 4-phosphate cytidylyltransferase [Oscillospiraceae bacterium]